MMGEDFLDFQDHYYTVWIRCPHCKLEQQACVVYPMDDPYPAYEHECDRCQCWITEKDWDEIPEGGTEKKRT